MAQVCTPTGEQCYDCADYAGAFACLDKVRISDMAEASELEIQAALDSACDKILLAAEFVPCNDEPYTQAINLSSIISGASGNPLGATFWTPIDFGDTYSGCWYKFNTDLVITRSDFPEFFEAAGIAGDTYTIPGMQGKFPMGAGTNYCNAGSVTGSDNNEVTLSCENLPACTIQINDPGHVHTTVIGVDVDGQDFTNPISLERDSGKLGQNTNYQSNASATGITATHRVGQSGNGTPVAIDVQPWAICGSWYIKLSNSCS